jgi:multidrug resistance protein, MATE family
LTSANPIMNRRILRLAVPNIISNITVPLLGMVDLALMGHLDNKVYIGAVALGGMIFNFIYWGFGFLRMSTSGFVAQAFGRRDFPEVMLNLARPLGVALVSGIGLVILQIPIAALGFWIIDSSTEVEELARQYYHIRIFAAPATISLYAFSGWFIGMQNTRIPMVIAITANLLNIGFSFLFVRGLGMTADGVALGTLIAQYLGLLMAIYFMRRYYGRFLRHFNWGKVLERAALWRFFHVNKDILIRTLCLILALSFFTAKSASMGDTPLAVNSLLLQFFMFFSFFIDGYAHAAEALTGRFIGAGNKAALMKSIRLLFIWGAGVSAAYTLAYLFGGESILRLLTSNAEVIEAARPYLIWPVIVPMVAFSAFLLDGIFIGATASAAMRNSMLISTLVIYFPAYYLLAPHLGNNALWLALILLLGARGITLALMLRQVVISPVQSKPENAAATPDRSGSA